MKTNSSKNRELWWKRWNAAINTSTKLPYNKPDTLIWNKETKIFSVIKISCPADVNITKKK